MLEFYLVRFLYHIYSILRVHYLEEEHSRLIKELEQQNQNAAELRSKSVQDSLTGIFNRQYVIDKAGALLETGEPFSLVFLDLDKLKMVNDREGHQAGDLYLIRFAEEFGARLRETDIFARVGGDEFVVLLLDCTERNTRERMEKIRLQLSAKFNPLFSFSYGCLLYTSVKALVVPIALPDSVVITWPFALEESVTFFTSEETIIPARAPLTLTFPYTYR